MPIPPHIEQRIIQILIDQCAKACVELPDYKFFTDKWYTKRYPLYVTSYGNKVVPAGFCGFRTVWLNENLLERNQDALERVLLHELAHYMVDKRGLREEDKKLRISGQREDDTHHGQIFVNILWELFCAHDKNLIEKTYCLDGYPWTSRILKKLKGTPGYKKLVKRLNKKSK